MPESNVGAHGSSGRMNPKLENILRVGVIGIGQMGILHAAIANVFPSSTLISMCDVDDRITKLASKLLPRVRFYNDPTKMIKEENLDAVYVCTPVHTHAQIVSDILENGNLRGIFVEKPLADSHQAAARLVEDTKNLITVVGFQKRFAGTYKRAKELLDMNVLGKLRFFRSHFYTSENIDHVEGWKFQKETGGVLLEFAPHLLDLLYWYFGEPRRVYSLSTSVRSGEVEDYIHTSFDFADGPSGYADICWAMRNFRPGELMLDLHGEKGALTVNESKLVLYLDDDFDNQLKKGTHFWTAHDLTPPVRFLLAYPENVLIDFNFLQCVANNIETKPSFADGARVNLMIEQIRSTLRNQ